MELRENMHNLLCFFLFVYLFVRLIIFLHFHISSVWFVLADNRILTFFIIIILKFLTIFLPVNMRKFVNSILTFIVNRRSHLRLFLKIVIHFRYTWRISVVSSIPVKLHVVCLPFLWKWAPLWMFLEYFPYFIIYCVNSCFGGNCP